MIDIRFIVNRIIFSIVILLILGKAYSIDFNDKQKVIIYNEAIKILRNYQQYSNQMADAVTSIDELNKISQKLIDQFVSRKAIIFNDLDPAHKLSEAYELETYVANILLWYPDGMKINLDFDNLKAGNIISHGNDIFTVDIMTNKKIDGNYLNKQQNTNKEELLFRVAFFQKGNVFENYKIAGVRSSKSTTLSDDSKLLAEVKSVEFSEKDMQLIKEQTKALMNDYINFLNLLTDPKETNDDKAYYKISFLGLFKDSTLSVANDIEPDPQNRWLKITDYQQRIISSYPEGIRNLGINIDSAEYGKVVAEGNNKYYINGYIDKFFSGKFQSKTVFRDNSKYDFKVSFDKDENTFKNFKLASIDKFGVNLYSQTAANTKQELPQLPISSLKRSGLYIGLSMGVGKTIFNNENLSSNSSLSWTGKGNGALNLEAQATYYLYNRVGFKSGLSFNRYSVNSNLTGNFLYQIEYTDINDDKYKKNITSEYDSIQTLSYISIPLTIIVHSNSDPEKWGIYAEAGLIASFNISSNYKTTGSISKFGIYSNGDPITNVPELGFIDRYDINEEGKSAVSLFHLAFKASIGVSYPINYFTTVSLGPEFIWGMSSISNEKNYTDAFGIASATKKVGISKYGIKFGISYKF
ncbi:MAG: outer membrane beta-barrel protein [Tenuifilaceae bacterium]